MVSFNCSMCKSPLKMGAGLQCRCPACDTVQYAPDEFGAPVPVNQHVNRPSNTTTHVEAGAKMFGIVLLVSFLVLGLFIAWPVVILIAIIGFLIFWIGTWGVTTGAGDLLYGKDPNYQEYKRRGGSPFLDSLPWPLNSGDANYVVLPHEEPEYTTFNPPTNWIYQCNRCGARVESDRGYCWNCQVNLEQPVEPWHPPYQGNSSSDDSPSMPMG